MTGATSNKTAGTVYWIAGVLLLALSVMDLAWWISVSSDATKSLDQMNREYAHRYPVWLRTGRLLRICNIGILALAVLFFLLAKSRLARKGSVTVMLVIAIVLIAWQLLSFA